MFFAVNLDAFTSTCSEVATHRGPHQKVISFSFYGNPKNRRDYFPVSLRFKSKSTYTTIPDLLSKILSALYIWHKNMLILVNDPYFHFYTPACLPLKKGRQNLN